MVNGTGGRLRQAILTCVLGCDLQGFKFHASSVLISSTSKACQLDQSMHGVINARLISWLTGQRQTMAIRVDGNLGQGGGQDRQSGRSLQRLYLRGAVKRTWQIRNIMIMDLFRHHLLRTSWVSGSGHAFARMMIFSLMGNPHNDLDLVRQDDLHLRCVCCDFSSLEFAGNAVFLYPTYSKSIVCFLPG